MLTPDEVEGINLPRIGDLVLHPMFEYQGGGAGPTPRYQAGWCEFYKPGGGGKPSSGCKGNTPFSQLQMQL